VAVVVVVCSMGVAVVFVVEVMLQACIAIRIATKTGSI